MTMKIWLMIFLAVIVVVTVMLQLIFVQNGDGCAHIYRQRFRRSKTETDQAAVICQTILDTDNPVKAYSLFIEYVFSNNRKFIRFVSSVLMKISEAYRSADVPALKRCVDDITGMKSKLKCRKINQDACVERIDPAIVIESSAWVNMSVELCFMINDNLRRLANVCIEFNSLYSMQIQDEYTERLSFFVQDICNICKSADDMLAVGDVEGMKELRIRSAIIKSESYNVAQSLYQLLHDQRTHIDPTRRVALSYALNAFYDCQDIIYALRRMILCNICLTLYDTDAINDSVTSEELAKFNN